MDSTALKRGLNSSEVESRHSLRVIEGIVVGLLVGLLAHPVYVTHGSSDLRAANHRLAVKRRSYVELEISRNRWQKAIAEDKCRTNSHPEA
ncbi:hypothetical protein BHM03_00034887 [Ensete ventricosum]|nr:hypothetical protein BHM03_00034887 [Ensete ventricosum]